MVIGAALFGLYYWVNPLPETIQEHRIFISQSEIERLRQGWESKWNRQISDKELQTLIESHIREEVYYREALALGLDKDDTVLRRRLKQKLEFLTNDIVDMASPDPAMLKAYLVSHKDRYLLPETITFRHVYFSPEKRGAEARIDADKLLTELTQQKVSDTGSINFGDAFFLEHEYSAQSQQQIERAFGPEFAAAALNAAPSVWRGPFESAYGLHLVQVASRTESKLPDLSAIKDKVERDWRYDQRQTANEAIYQRLKEKYQIVIEDRKSSGDTSHAQSGMMNAS